MGQLFSFLSNTFFKPLNLLVKGNRQIHNITLFVFTQAEKIIALWVILCGDFIGKQDDCICHQLQKDLKTENVLGSFAVIGGAFIAAKRRKIENDRK